ncbi:DMT family transporter [Parvularcula lutaonensis]|uniref:DMT family transporter n=1 Tax=Parvularcula lutaonensis TaxID=491923 RepID=A0ABV7MCS4_9PROT|nr:DMT family transporter [Parvularcula lutaonensis]GGY39908.1 drug/metabolite DMT transporter permease [Parvularcula lutaonensis]
MKPAHALLLIAICLAWGLHMVIVKAVTGIVDPLTYVAFRMPILALILSPLLRWYPGQMHRVLIAGACFGGLNYMLMFTGISLTTASIGSVLAESYVIIATIFSVVFLGETVGWKRIAGIATALIGVLIIATADGDATGSANLPLGAFLIICGCTAEATGAIFVKKIDGVKPLALLAWMALVGSIVSILPAAILAKDHFAWISDGSFTAVSGALLYSILIASVFGHTSYYFLLQRVPLSIIAPSGLLITFFAVLFGVLLLGEVLTPRLILGTGLVVAGVAVVLLRSHQPDRKQVLAAAAASDDQPAQEALTP